MEDYFSLLGVPPVFTLEQKALEQAYFAAQRATHPDRFIGKAEAERVAAILRSQAVNEAYEALKNPLTRAEHLLALRGHAPLAEGAQASPALLMEMMELREALAEAAGDGPALASVVATIKRLHGETLAALADAFAQSNDATAIANTQRLHYLGKAMEEAQMRVYQLKAAHE